MSHPAIRAVAPRRALASLCLLLTILAPATPALAAEEAAASFGERLSLTVVEVPVQVLQKGEPVRGLTEKDFAVYDDGVERELSSFEVVDLDTRNTPAGAAASAETDGLGRNLLLFFDLDFASQHDLLRAVKAASAMTKTQLHPRDRVAIVLYSYGIGLRLLCGFTQDRETLQAGFDLARSVIDRDQRAIEANTAKASPAVRTAASPAATSRLRQLARAIGPAGALVVEGPGGGGLTGQTTGGGPVANADDLGLVALTATDRPGDISSGGEALDVLKANVRSAEETTVMRQVRNMGQSLGDLVTLLRDIEGPKHVLFFSSGFPVWAIGLQGIARDSEALFASFRRAGWAIQAVDLSGIASAETVGGEFLEDGFHADSLLYLARGTGGEVFENYNRLEQATGAVLDRTSVTYLLTFTVSDLPADDTYRKIEVKLRDPSLDARLVYRPGYFTAKPATKRTGIERRLDLAQLLLGQAERHELTASVLAVPLAGYPSSAPPTSVALVLEASGQDLLAEHHNPQLAAEIQVLAIDESGEPADFFAKDVALDLGRRGDELRQSGLRLYGELALAPGRYRLRVRLAEAESGKVFLSTLPLVVPEPGRGPALLPPLFVAPRQEGVLVRPGFETAETARFPFTSAGRDFLPRVSPRLGGQESIGVCLITGKASRLALGGRVLTLAGEVAAGGKLDLLSRTSEADGFDRVMGVFSPAGLAPGEYQLEVTATDGATGEETRRTARFSVGNESV